MQVWEGKSIRKQVGLKQPAVPALLATLVIIAFIQINIPEYKLELKNISRFGDNEFSVFDDIDGNGYSDQISVINNAIGNAAVTVRFEPTLEALQFNVPGRFRFATNGYLIIGDYDGNRKKEIYFFTVSHDTIYLNSYHPDDENASFRSVFVSTCGERDGNSDVYVLPGRMEDLNSDGSKELCFGISSGFSLFPRNYFTYDIRNKKFGKSPFIGCISETAIQQDVNKDGVSEFIPRGYQPGNLKDTTGIFHDHSFWYMVMDKEFNFLFPPVEFRGTSEEVIPFIVGKKEKRLCIYHRSVIHNERKIDIHEYDLNGKLKKTVEINDIDASEVLSFNSSVNDDIPIAFSFSDGGLAIYDTTFRFVKKMLLSLPLQSFIRIDADQDGEEEIVSCSYNTSSLHILRTDLADPVSVKLNLQPESRTEFCMITEPGKKPLLFVGSGNNGYILSYHFNPNYNLKWLIYLVIFIGAYLFTWGVRLIQQEQIRRKQRILKRISELQMKIVKNQMDPHFTMNALNSVISAINEKDMEAAGKHLMHFSRMYRSLVLSADKYLVPLSEELDFTENYIELEKFRFRDRFSYRKIIDEAVDLSWPVPKMIIEAQVENSIRHGLSQLESGGMITISISTGDHKMLVSVEDNGIGRSRAAEIGSGSTGKGNEITRQYCRLYQSITGDRIVMEIMDLFDQQNIPAGTRVILSIPVK